MLHHMLTYPLLAASLMRLLLLLLPLVSSFDTGHHYDATRNALEIRNFSRTTDVIPVIQLCNFIPDWNSLSYEVRVMRVCVYVCCIETCMHTWYTRRDSHLFRMYTRTQVNMPNYKKYKEMASLLHFNNLVTGKLVRDYWSELTHPCM